MTKGRIGPGEYEHPGGSVGDVRTRYLLQIRADLPHVLEALRALDGSDAALLAWASTWHLQDPWTIDVARRTREAWDRWPAVARHLYWADAILTGEIVPEPPDIRRWEFTQESEPAFRARVEEYIGNAREQARAMGLSEPPVKPKLARDLGALVQYQVKGDDLDAVADEFFGGDQNEDTARKALASLAQLIGVTLRSSTAKQ